MDREIRLQRLIDMRNRKQIFCSQLLTFAMVSVLLSVLPAVYEGFGLAFSTFFGFAIMFILISFVPLNEVNKLREQINREYGKPEENIDFK